MMKTLMIPENDENDNDYDEYNYDCDDDDDDYDDDEGDDGHTWWPWKSAVIVHSATQTGLKYTV